MMTRKCAYDSLFSNKMSGGGESGGAWQLKVMGIKQIEIHILIKIK